MRTSGNGELLNRRFGVSDAPTLTATVGEDEPVRFSRLRFDGAGLTLGDIPAEPAYSIVLNMGGPGSGVVREAGRAPRRVTVGPGVLCSYDLSSPPKISFDTSFNTLRSYVPMAAIREYLQDSRGRAPVYLNLPESGTVDLMVSHLVATLDPMFGRPDEMHSLFIDHVALALQSYLVQAYGTEVVTIPSIRCGLAPWQERRAKETMNASLHKRISIAEVARECGLSSSHFARAFKQATGQPPYRWLLQRRIEVAQGLLANSQMSLQEIAVACGSPDQTVFTRAFTRSVGTSPAAWRRKRRG